MPSHQPPPRPEALSAAAWLPISLRLVLPAVLTIILFTTAIFFIILPAFKGNIMERKRAMSRELTQTAWNTLEFYHAQVEKGLLTKRRAQDMAVAQLRAQRFGAESKDYFWINDLKPHMIMHPYRADLEGKDVSHFADPKGKRLFLEVVDTVKKNGAGYVDYMWQWKDDPRHIVPKVSFVRLFKPWGWVVGTGIYVEDVKAEISSLTGRLTTVSFSILAVIALLVFFMAQEGLRAERRRRQTEYGLRHSQGMLSLVMDNIPQFIFWKDREGVYLGCNRGFAAHTGLEDSSRIVGLSDQQVPWGQENADRQRARERKVMSGGRAELHSEERHPQPGGGFRWVDVNRIPLCGPGGEVRGILCTQEDITQRKEMEQLVRIQDKMASLGRIAAGMAHEIRNPLSGVNMYLSALEGLEPGDKRHREILAKLKAASGKIEAVIKRVLDFAKPGTPRPTWVQVNRVIAGVVELSGVTLRKSGVSLDASLDRNLPLCFVDAQLLEQVLLNLVTNAVQALAGWPRKRRIRLSSALDKERIIIQVADSGPGVPEEIAGRIFDPLFHRTKRWLRHRAQPVPPHHKRPRRQPHRGDQPVGRRAVHHHHPGHSALRLRQPWVGKEGKRHGGKPFSKKRLPPGPPYQKTLNGLVCREWLISIAGFNTMGGFEKAIRQGKGSVISYSIFVVDDEESIRDAAELGLTGYEVRTFATAEEAIEAVKQGAPDLILQDIGLPGMDGVECMRRIKEIAPEVLFIMITAFEDVDTVVRAMRQGAHDYVVKPLHLDTLKHNLENALETIRLRKEVRHLQKRYLEENLPLFIGESNTIQNVMEFVARVAKSPDMPVLILGQTGTGKELIAGAIHYQSPNFQGPLVTVNCAAIPSELIESELFGYEPGAFSGAKPGGKVGLIEKARGGTLFLDEVGDLSLQAQAKLLRFLDSGEFYRVGGSEPRKVRTRVVSATNRDLEDMMGSGDFRRDLYFRLAMVKVQVPSLERRTEDIMPIALHFLNEMNRKYARKFTGIDPEAEAWLKGRPWQGNVRELKGIIERGALMAKEPLLTLEDLGEGEETQPAGYAPGGERLPGLDREGLALDEILKQTERRYFREALELSRGNERKAAELLGMNYHTFRYRRKKLLGE